MTARPIFLLMVPDRKPRMECACHPVAFISSLAVTPPGCFSSSRTLAVLVPSRAPLFSPLAFFAALGAFLAGLAFLPALLLFGATWGRRAQRWVALGSGASGDRSFLVASV